MKTKIRKIGDTVVICMDGKLDYEIQGNLKQDLTKLASGLKSDVAPKKIIFNLENLEFVGSSGISSFVQSLQEINNSSSIKPRYCNVRSEFQRVMKAFDEEGLFEFYDNEERARRSFDN